MYPIVTLDRVETSEEFDLINIYNATQDPDVDTIEDDSPFDLLNKSCNYYSSSQFVDKIASERESQKLSAFSLNCRGLNAHFDDLKLLVASTSSDKFSFDVIGFNEIHNNIDKKTLY